MGYWPPFIVFDSFGVNQKVSAEGKLYCSSEAAKVYLFSLSWSGGFLLLANLEKGVATVVSFTVTKVTLNSSKGTTIDLFN